MKKPKPSRPGRPKSPAKADAIMQAHRNPSYDHKRRAQLDFDDPPPADPEAPPPPPKELPQGQQANPAAVPFQQSKAVREYYNALSAKLEFEEKVGNLTNVKEVEREAFQTFRDVRDALQNIPNRVVAAIVAELKLEASHAQDKVFLILNKEIADALEVMADGPSQS